MGVKPAYSRQTSDGDSPKTREAVAETVPISTEVIIIGAAIAGSLLALALGRRGVSVAIVDLQSVYPADFRCEKFSQTQVDLLRDARVADVFDALLPAGLTLTDVGLRYETMVNAARLAWPDTVRFVQGKAAAAVTGDDSQRVTLADGTVLEGRLLVLATGPGERLRASLGFQRRLLRERHSLSVGFSIRGKDGGPASVQSLVRYGERAGDGIGFVSMFPLGEATRVNLFCFHDVSDAFAREVRADPAAALCKAIPSLPPIFDDAAIVGPVEVRSTDLYRTEGHEQPGVVLVGDAFASCSPAIGMGLTRILAEVRQLAFTHLPAWLATPGMGADKIAEFYADPFKRDVDGLALRRSHTARASATDTSLTWRAFRGLARLRRRARALAACFAPSPRPTPALETRP